MATTRATPWYLEIVRVSSRATQQDLLTLLHDVASVTALGCSSGPDHYVVFECPDRRLKTSIEKLFGAVDPASVLTETHHQPLHGTRGVPDDRYTARTARHRARGPDTRG